MKQFLAGMVCGAALLFVFMHYHVVHGKNGVVLVPKITNNLSEIYTDIRAFGLADWQRHRTLAAAIMKSRQAYLLEDTAHRSFGNAMRSVVDELFGERSTSPR